MGSSEPQTLTKEEIEITDLARYAKEKVEVNEVWEYEEVACIQVRIMNWFQLLLYKRWRVKIFSKPQTASESRCQIFDS